MSSVQTVLSYHSYRVND